ncbi:DISARM system phospholipase D-like protein DrmC [Natronosporangium hydrolyticum]|uniref:phospholipase D n=1 Tax=Natronosporangium hydrolyticum TaxID=2811111 RepID=A0A895YGK0_9ACTN|nr:DISARM system phospholipase D-like protein DrmC [Natronosporangium hydrolyticum]QSB16691.1 DISARM system phospholipase D-like protein DrmC [Natronosporangium hydrolyticum]
MNAAFETASAALAAELGPDRLRRLAEAIEAGEPRYALSAIGLDHPAVAQLLAVLDAGPPELAASYLRGLAAGYAHRAAAVSAELVWTGPTTFDVPVRSTAQVLADLVDQAASELILVTYAARPHPPLLAALAAATDRGVSVWIVVETLGGAGSALQGEQPAKAFADLPKIPLFTWAIDRRPDGARMHAKLVVADERVLFVSSANLTAAGIGSNVEAGLLVSGGPAARRAAEHLRAMRRHGLLVRI